MLRSSAIRSSTMTEGLLAPHTASPPYVVSAILKAVQLQPHDVFYDLGCGAHARVLIMLAEQIVQQCDEPMHHQQAAGLAGRALTTAGQQALQGSCCNPISTSSSNSSSGKPQQECPSSEAGPHGQPHWLQQHQCSAGASAQLAAAAEIGSQAGDVRSHAYQDLQEIQQQEQQQDQISQQHQQQEQIKQQQEQQTPAVQHLIIQQYGGSASHPKGPKFIGVELNPQAAEAAAAAVRALPGALQEKVAILQGDLLEVALHDATVVYAYLLPQGLSLLASKLLQELQPGALVMTYLFQIRGWENRLHCSLPVTSGDARRPDVSGLSKLYVYRL